MPRITIDVAFGRGSEHPVMYVLKPEKTLRALHEDNLILKISDRVPHRLGGDGWRSDQLTGDINRGWLYHGVLKTYPKAAHSLARDSGRSMSSPSSGSSRGGFATPPQAELQVAVKWVRGMRAIESLRREARMYDSVLWPLQGSAVPNFYGLFVGMENDVEVGCLLLEWCPGNDPVAAGKPTADVLRMRAQAVQDLHKVGVHHGQLYERPDALCVSDGRHFLRAQDGTIRIVDFQRANMHQCRVSEVHDVDEYADYQGSPCNELAFAFGYSHNAYTKGLLKSIPWNTY
ncbi:hypothetical protein L226DRAFT_607270 [Lentinus tigrinus ALCF2SS1-7]|uniref:Protein kinase domain-containing protein n=1 Tax=Lentinus tigrinus ALCF2SS1-6 TaxID=1328759 RepID=A0A5C2SMZ8_9APHY|nr:hypothetical protein L227DRAFT_650132 [Lentinus tigrinus ALCF2SS1-6]RPD82077.1 hypothetical protein L226DRAFT_607270 [Lentinus tigrinus ALCF2SS1-7]